MNILEQIIRDKRAEVALRKAVVPTGQLEACRLMERDPRSLVASLGQRPSGIIAEHKRRSPSRAVINQGCSVEAVVKGYERGGAAAISVLTDGKYFGGSLDDLLLARASTDLPLLRKEFIIDPYQVLEARAYGADAILLIAAVLDPGKIRELCGEAHALGMEVLLEVHDREELERSLEGGADLIGVNNRNLKTFEVSLDTSRELISLIPAEVGRVSESGLGHPGQLRELQQLGYQGFLMGESFMKQPDPGAALAEFVKTLEP
jgi:indole-3-glycerol phosphate synthase